MRARLPRPRGRIITTLASAVALTTGLAACASKQSHPTSADNEGVYVYAGPLTYQVQLSRALNPFTIEDRQYLIGTNASPPTANQEWFAVFVWALNQTSHNQTTTTSFDIVDTQGTKYYPVPINSQVNPYAWTQQTLAPKGIEPTPGSTAYYGPSQGGELLFKLNDSAYSNRPLTLQIFAPGQSQPSTVSLDL